jgi:hypothetical protein
MNFPFPGMDPYLEHHTLWPGVHNRLIVALANQIQPRLLPRYLASIEQRVFVEQPPREVIPDIHIRRQPTVAPPVAPSADLDTPVVLTVDDVEVQESYIQILDRYAQMRVVTVIEVVSPSNKRSRNGRRSYLQKQRETLAGERHLVEIDLLRRGRHVLSVPRWRADDLGEYDYLVCVSRWPERRRYELYPRQVRDRLPRVPVPLAAPDADISMDVQAAVEQVHREGCYALMLHYDRPCEPALPAADQQWASQCITTFKAARPDLFPVGGSTNGAAGDTPAAPPA